jgi:hypothetical protein
LWLFKAKDDDLIYIENTSKTKVLQFTSDGNVTQEVFGKKESPMLKATLPLKAILRCQRLLLLILIA